MTDPEAGYINYFEILGVAEDAKPGEVRKEYRARMKRLVADIARLEITEERRSRFLLDMAKLNAAFYILWKPESREAYWGERQALIELEERWRSAVRDNASDTDSLRRDFDRRIRDFLAKYVEESMLEAGRDKDCVEFSHWDVAHERHAFRILRYYRQTLYQQILERLPFVDVTPPRIDWDERTKTVAAILNEGR